MLLRLTRSGDDYIGYFDPDGRGWIRALQTSASFTDVRVGLIAGQNQSLQTTVADFDYFVIE